MGMGMGERRRGGVVRLIKREDGEGEKRAGKQQRSDGEGLGLGGGVKESRSQGVKRSQGACW